MAVVHSVRVRIELTTVSLIKGNSSLSTWGFELR